MLKKRKDGFAIGHALLLYCIKNGTRGNKKTIFKKGNFNMIIKNVGIILAPGHRSNAYLQNLTKNKLIPSYALVMIKNRYEYLLTKLFPDKLVAMLQFVWQNEIMGLFRQKNNDSKVYFNPHEPILYTVKRSKLSYDKIHASNCNDKKIIDAIRRRHEKVFIYSGGGILKKEILGLGKKFIHVHPGIVPFYRGSTCFYYSIIKDRKLGATAFFMEKEIDKGKVIAQKQFKKPNIKDIDNIIDPYIRSDLLVDVMRNYVSSGSIKSEPQNKNVGETYFVIHPVLKHLAILDCIRKSKIKRIHKLSQTN
jgi:methionyl-tRNA formyltransferase